jgi:hypothetical protein
MASTSRALTLKLLADVDNFTKGLNKADNEVSSFGDKVSKFGKVAAGAFAAAGVAAAAYAGKLLVDGVKSAIEDEAAQLRLATALKNVTGATDAQINATEDYITKTTLATGVTDDELRPSLQRLVTATDDVAKAQKLQGLALDISAGSGKSLEAVSNALAKAQEGQTAGLVKLGIGLSAAELKTMSMEQISVKLADTFGGQAATQADTFAGKMQRLQVAFDEGKETVGSFVLDAITPLVSGFVNNVIPAIQKLSDELGPKLTPIFQTLTRYISEYVIPAFRAAWSFITEYVVPALRDFLTPIINSLRAAFEKVAGKIKENEEQLKPLLAFFKAVATFVRDVLAPVLGRILGNAFEVLGTAIGIVIDLFSNLVDVVNKAFNAIKAIVNFVKNNPVTQALGGVIDNVFGGGRANGGPVRSGTSYIVGERGPELFVPNTNGLIIPNGQSMSGTSGSNQGSTINITVNGAIDSESTARQIVSILNNSSARGTLGSLAFNT